MKQCSDSGFVRLGDVARQLVQQLAEKRNIHTLSVNSRAKSAKVFAGRVNAFKVKP